MVLLLISILPMCLFHAMGSPQLKLGHSGYELISINEQNADDSMLLSSKLALEGASRYSRIGALNLEKATEPTDEDDGFSTVLQQHKHHYDPHRSSSAAKAISESQSNMIEVTNKQSSNEKPNIYLTLGVPKTFTKPTTTVKETQTVISNSEKTNQNSQSKDSYDDSDSAEESGNQQKVNTKSMQVKSSDKKSKTAAKLSKSFGDMSEKIGIQQSDSVSSPMLESDVGSAVSKDNDNFINLMADVQRVWNLIDAKSDFQKKLSKIDPPTVKSGFTMVTHFPSLRIHHQKNSYVSHKSPAMFSPIYPSGLDIIASNSHKKSTVPIKDQKELHGKHIRIDHKNPKSSKEFGKFYQEKTGQSIPSVLVLNNIHREHSNPKVGSILGANYKTQPFLNQQPIRPMRQIITHLEMNSIPSTTNHFDPTLPTAGAPIFNPQGRWEKIMPRYTMDLANKHQQNNDFDRQYLDSNHLNPKTELKADFLKNYFRKISLSNEQTARHVEPAINLLPLNVEASKSLIIGIVHDIAPVDSEETVIGVKKEDLNGETHDMHDVSHPHSSASSKSSCKQMKASTPAFYQFLAKFSNTVLGKALEYESDTQAQDSVSKLVEATTNKNLDNDILEFLD